MSLKNENKASSLNKEVIEWIETFVWPVVSIVLIFTFFVRTASVSGISMMPTLHDADKLLITHLGYTPISGDIVVLVPPGYSDQPLVKRVIATEGQKVDINFKEGIVTVDGAALDEPYINESTHLEEGVTFPQTVPEGCIFVLGDNRNHSTDSRDPSVGMVDKRYVLGKEILRFMPFNKIGAVD